jgi:hypothetical protein
MTRIKRTPQQIADDLRIKAEQAAFKAQVADASTNPTLAPLADALKKAQTKVNALKRAFADTNPNSFDNRIRGFNLRIAEIEAGAKLAAAQLEDADATVDALKADFDDFAVAVSNGRNIDDIATDVQSTINSYALSAFPELEVAFEAAQYARKSFKAGIGPEVSDAVPAQNAE